MRHTFIKLSTLLACAIGASTFSYAQDTGTDARVLEEVIVTAQKISEKLQNVPISISVATAQDLKNINAFDFQDVEEITPGIAFGGGAGLQSAAIRIRGVGPAFFALGTPPNVAVFVDQVAQSQIGAVFSTMVDVERIELLRGPQGTLYGRNAPGGAYNITTQSPDHEGINGYFEGTYSQYESSDLAGTDFRGAINIPLIDSVLAWRLAGVLSENDGYVRLVNPDATDDTTGGHDNQAIRSKLLWTPSEDVSLLWTVNYQDLEQNPAGFNYDGLVPGSGGTAASPVPAVINRFDNRSNYGIGPSLVTGDLKDTSLHLSWETDSFDLDVIGFYQEFDTFSDEVRDPFFNARGFFQISADSEITTLEVRVSDSNDTLDYVAGIYYFDTTFVGFNNILTQGVNVNGNFDGSTTGYAGFGNVNFHLSPKWDLALGLRYDDVEDELTSSTTFSGITAALDDELSFDNVSWSIKLRHYINENLTAYMAVDQAFKQGGFNGLVAGVQALNDTFGLPIPPAVAQAAADTLSYDDESSEAIEFGIKGSFLDSRLSASAAIFYQRYDDHQVGQTNNQPQALGPIFGSFFLAAITNAEEVVTKGIEFDLTYLMGDNWEVALRAAYSDPEVEEWSSRFCPGGENETPDQLLCPLGGGETLNALPNWSGNLQLGYQNRLAAGWDFYSRATLTWQDEPSRTNVTDQFAESKTRYGLSAGINNAEMGLDVRAWAKNLGDEDLNVNPGTRANGDPNLPPAFQGGFSPGREYGVTVRYSF